MSKLGFFAQVAMIAIAVAIGYLYIKPTVTQIRDTENMIAVYNDEIKNVSGVNQKLGEKIRAINAIPPGDTQALLRYLPDSVDDIAVMKDISTIFAQIGISSPQISFSGAGKAETGDSQGGFIANVAAYQFGVEFKTTYPKLLSVLSAIEVNNYLLQVQRISVTPSDEGPLIVKIELVAYALVPLQEEVPAQPISFITIPVLYVKNT